MNPAQKKSKQTALDSLMSAERHENEKKEADSSTDGYLSSEVDTKSPDLFPSDNESSGDGTHFKGRTGVFTQDFPPSPKVPKGKGKKSVGEGDKTLTTGESAGVGEGYDGGRSTLPDPLAMTSTVSGGNSTGGPQSAEGTNGSGDVTSTVNVNDIESDDYLQPSGTVAKERTAQPEVHFNIVKGRFSRKGSTGAMSYVMNTQ